ncbi:MAG: S8 family peptidase [Micromonosporaceae bacterium]
MIPAVVGVVLISLAQPAGAAPAPGEAGTELPGQPGAGDSPSRQPAAEPESRRITLVTGDVVLLTRAGEQQSAEVVRDVPPVGDVSILMSDTDVYAIPGVAAPMLARDELDRELFNLTQLVEDGYDDTHAAELPLIVSYDSASAEHRAAGKAAPDGSRRTHRLKSARAHAVRVNKDRSSRFWADVTAKAEDHRRAGMDRSGPRQLQAALDVAKIWLDAKVDASDDVSRVTIGADKAWTAGYDGEGQTVAVLDTGIDTDHPDLAGRVAAAQNFTDSDTTGDRVGHGTHVASIIAGTGAASDGRYAGAAPKATLVNAKVLDDSGSGAWSGVIAGMEWAATRADVVNMSLGGGASDGADPISQALNVISEETGALFVVAAGNEELRPQSVTTPAAADAALAVGATTRDGAVTAYYSSVGPRLDNWALKPEISAPGSGIVAARAGSDGYVGYSGTSMAAPHVAASAAIVRQRHPDWTAQQVRDALTSTARPTANDPIWWQGAGVVDVGTAVTQDLHATGILQLGVDPFPQNPGDTLKGAVTYTNDGDQPVTLDLTSQWWQAPVEFGRYPVTPWTPSAGAVAISPSSVTVPAHGSTTATLTIATDQTPFGSFYGRVVAAAADGTTTVRTAVAFSRDVERHRLTIEAVDRDGLPVHTTAWSLGVLQHLETGRWHWVIWDHGTARYSGAVRGDHLPAGPYAFLGHIGAFGPAPYYPMTSWTMVAEPELILDQDRSLVLDTRKAGLVDVRTQRPSVEAAGERHKGDDWQIRESPAGRMALKPGLDLNLRSFSDVAPEVYTLASKTAATTGSYRYQHNTHRTAPPITLRFADRTVLGDYPGGYYRIDDFQVRLARFPSHLESTLVNVGTGSEAEIKRAGVAGRLALLRPGEDWDGSLDEPARRLAAAGAAGVIVATPLPGFGNASGYAYYREELADVPVAAVGYEDGRWLADLVADRPAPLILRGIFPTPYSYDLMADQQRRLTNGLRYHPLDHELAEVTAQYRTDGPARWSDVRHRPADDIWGTVRVREFP